MLTVHAATGPEMVDELADVVAQELAAIAEAGPTEAELQRSKAQLKAGLLMALESSSVNAEQMARQLLAHGRLVTTAELIDEVTSVDRERDENLRPAFDERSGLCGGGWLGQKVGGSGVPRGRAILGF